MTRGEGDDETQRFLRAVGRDVDLDEDRLDYHAPTRTLTLAGVGSRKKASADRKTSELAVFVLRAAREHPGCTGRAIDGFVKEMDDAPPFRHGDTAKAAKYAESKGLMRIERGGERRPSQHYAIDTKDAS